MLWASIQEWVLESLLVPYALLVEDEKLLRFHVAEDHVLIEEISGPNEFIGDGLRWNFLEIFDIDDVL